MTSMASRPDGEAVYTSWADAGFIKNVECWHRMARGQTKRWLPALFSQAKTEILHEHQAAPKLDDINAAWPHGIKAKMIARAKSYFSAIDISPWRKSFKFLLLGFVSLASDEILYADDAVKTHREDEILLPRPAGHGIWHDWHLQPWRHSNLPSLSSKLTDSKETHHKS